MNEMQKTSGITITTTTPARVAMAVEATALAGAATITRLIPMNKKGVNQFKLRGVTRKRNPIRFLNICQSTNVA